MGYLQGGATARSCMSGPFNRHAPATPWPRMTPPLPTLGHFEE